MTIWDSIVSAGCFIICEAGVNHNGDYNLAIELVEAAAACGANAVKFQTFVAEEVVTKTAPKAKYQLELTNNQESQLEMLKKLELKQDDYFKLKERSDELGIHFMSTGYSKSDIEFLNDLGVEAFKTASIQLIEHTFLKFIASFNKPVIISTGMSTYSEIDATIQSLEESGNEQIVLLQCTSDYPTSLDEVNISVISKLKKYGLPVGLSDHTQNDLAAIGAVVLGAKVIEKHMTLDKNMEGPDHSGSLDVEEFHSMVERIRDIETIIGHEDNKPTQSELMNLPDMRRSIVTTQRIEKGSLIEPNMLWFKRPFIGESPTEINKFINKRINKTVEEDYFIRFEDIDDI